MNSQCCDNYKKCGNQWELLVYERYTHKKKWLCFPCTEEADERRELEQ